MNLLERYLQAVGQYLDQEQGKMCGGVARESAGRDGRTR